MVCQNDAGKVKIRKINAVCLFHDYSTLPQNFKLSSTNDSQNPILTHPRPERIVRDKEIKYKVILMKR